MQNTHSPCFPAHGQTRRLVSSWLTSWKSLFVWISDLWVPCSFNWKLSVRHVPDLYQVPNPFCTCVKTVSQRLLQMCVSSTGFVMYGSFLTGIFEVTFFGWTGHLCTLAECAPGHVKKAGLLMNDSNAVAAQLQKPITENALDGKT